MFKMTQLTTKLSATKIHQELTVMRLEDKWRKSFEPEGVKDKKVYDDINKISLTNTLSSQPDMDAAIRQTITTELTLHGAKGSLLLTPFHRPVFTTWYHSTQRFLTEPDPRNKGTVLNPTKPIVPIPTAPGIRIVRTVHPLSHRLNTPVPI
jgi:hypothetical protein